MGRGSQVGGRDIAHEYEQSRREHKSEAQSRDRKAQWNRRVLPVADFDIELDER